MWSLLAACGRSDAPPPPAEPAHTTAVEEPDALTEDELAARDAFSATPIAVTGRLLGDDGLPIAGATVTIGAASAETDAAGAFRLAGLPRTNAQVDVEAPGFRPHLAAAWLARPLVVAEVALDPVRLRAVRDDEARFLFGGDVSFARRFMDPDESTPRDEVPPSDPEALIDSADPLPGSLATVQWVAPLFTTADERVVNLETAVTTDPSTPHPDKDYVLLTLPASLPAITSLGVKFVSLGNNHVYDYLDDGVADTLANVDAAGLRHAGAGMDSSAAFVPYRFDLAGTPYTYVSATSVSGEQFAITYVATADKGGAADLRDDEDFVATMGAEVADGRVPIALLHTGTEYTYAASDYARERMALAATSGAALVVGHHPHVAQGVERLPGDVLAIDCLGNFVFDQDRLETMLAEVAQIELRGRELLGAELVPIYLEDYRPRFLVGPVADGLLRRIAGQSAGVELIPWGGRALVAWDAEPVATERTLAVPVPVDAGGHGVLDLRAELGPGEFVASVRADVPGATVQPGRDLLAFGGFEEDDVDEDVLEVSRWDVTSAASWPCLTGARTGAVGLCQVRDGGNVTHAVVALRQRVRVWGDAENTPDKDLLLVGYSRGEGAGPASIDAGYYASEGEAGFGDDLYDVHPAGTWDWAPFAFPLAMPPDGPDPLDPEANARAVRLFLHHAPPPAGSAEGTLQWDDLAIVSLDPAVPLDAGLSFAIAHDHDVFRVEAGAAVTVEVTISKLAPTWAAD